MSRIVRWFIIGGASVAFFVASISVSQSNSPTIINSIQALQNISLSGNYELGSDIDATATAMWNGGVGFLPIGTAATPFTGTLQGNGHTITGLFINSTANYVGLFGSVGPAAVIENLNLIAAHISGAGAETGGLAGHLDGQVTACTLNGSVTGSSNTNLGPSTGGLVGASDGVISSSSVNVTINTPGGGPTGGLVGYNTGAISGSASAGAVTTSNVGVLVGGLVGDNEQGGTISNSRSSVNVAGVSNVSGGTSPIGGLVGGLGHYSACASAISISNSIATGSVSGTNFSLVGGLVGDVGLAGTCLIQQSYATGPVTNGIGSTGGLVGINYGGGIVQQCLATGLVSSTGVPSPPGSGGWTGGLVGFNFGGAISQSYATGAVSGQTSSIIGGLAGASSGSVSQSYSVGAVEGPNDRPPPLLSGGLIGDDTGPVTSSYWDLDTSSQLTSEGGTGEHTSQLQTSTLPAGFDSTVWVAQSGMYPYLSWLGPAPITGYVDPKYMVVGVTYAPPGQTANSFVQYQKTNFVGNSQTVSNSFTTSNSLNFSVAACEGICTGGENNGVFGVTGGSLTETASGQITWTKTTKNSSTVTTSISVQNGEKTGPTGDPFHPVNHDFDIIWVWLNPVVILTFYGNTSYSSPTVLWNGYGFDLNDQSEAEIVPISLGYLNGDFGPMPPDITNSIKRVWAGSQIFAPGDGPALSSADLAQIAAADPFSASTYGPEFIGTTPPPVTADNRFAISQCSSGSLPYTQAAPSSTAPIFPCSLMNVNTSIQEQDITNTFSETYSVDVAFKNSAWIGSLTADVKDSNMLTITNETQQSITNTMTSTAMASVQGPPCNNAIPGEGPCNPIYDASGNQPTQFEVYQDNMYGTFMFAPVNYNWASATATPTATATATATTTATSNATATSTATPTATATSTATSTATATPARTATATATATVTPTPTGARIQVSSKVVVKPVGIGAGSSTANVIIKNIGKSGDLIGNISLTNNQGNGFKLSSSGSFDIPAHGKAFTDTLTFTPDAISDTARITINSNDPTPKKSTITIPLTGTGLTGKLSTTKTLTATSKGMGIPGTASLILKNVGKGVLMGSVAAATSPFSGGGVGFTIPPGKANPPIVITFTPNSLTSVTQPLDVTADDPSTGSMTVTLKGVVKK